MKSESLLPRGSRAALPWARWAAAAAGFAILLASAAPALARSGAEIIPSLLMTRSKGDDVVRFSGGLAVRVPVVRRLLDAEIGASYRMDEFEGPDVRDVRVHEWPITASLWLRPQRYLYAGGGFGWYNTTYEYPFYYHSDRTLQRVGVHVGGGVRLPLERRTALDLGVRYVFLESDASDPYPHAFDNDGWTTSLGLAVRF